VKDQGFGTAYETAVFKIVLDGLVTKYRIKRVLEYPITTLLNDFEYKHEAALPSQATYDLVWSFCHFEHAREPARLIEEMVTKTGKYVMITIQNNRNLGVILHWIYHKIAVKEWDHGRISRMSPRKLRKAIEEKGLVICEDGFHDAPWFILDVYECGDFLKKLVPESLRNKEKIGPSRFERMPRIVKSFLAHHYHVLAKRPLAE
jgi:SAM-dependent methyltransferase